MKNIAQKLLGALSLMMLAPSAFAQGVTNTGTADSAGFIGYMQNIEGQALYFVGFLMVIAGIAGVVFAYLLVMTIKDNVSDSPQSGQPEWGKAFGQFIVAAACLGGAGWIYSITTALNGTNIQDGAGDKVRDRYQGNQGNQGSGN